MASVWRFAPLFFGLAACAPTPEEIARELLSAGVGQILHLDPEEAAAGSQVSQANGNTPVVLMHGMGDFAENPMGMQTIRKRIGEWSGAYVNSVALCSKPTQFSDCDADDQNNGFFMTMDHQVDQFARAVRADPKLAGGFHAVGLSQGNTVIRGYIHRYNNPPVKAFVSLHGVLMGVAGLPQCPLNVTLIKEFCEGLDLLASHLFVYTSFLQNRLAQTNYFRGPKDLEHYRRAGHFLPYINNEVKGKENATYSSNFASLERLALVMALGDTMVHPKESEHFGYFKDGSLSELVGMQDAPWYKENWFGLRTLDEAKKIDFYSTRGNHLGFKLAFLREMVEKYFKPASQVVV